MPLIYAVNDKIEPEELAALYRRAGLNRPVDDLERIEAMIFHADLIVSAREGSPDMNPGRLVGAARSITDFRYCCYLSDLAVDPDHQRAGIGWELVRRTQQALGGEVMILLLSVPTAMEYYPKIGFEKNDRAFFIPRKR
jgi:ribosomal protein S18 acetylase RimI-like enzyme